MADFKCPFCGSDKLYYESPYVELNNMGEYVPKKKFCCKSQQQNHKFVKRFDVESRPDPEDIDQW